MIDNKEQHITGIKAGIKKGQIILSRLRTDARQYCDVLKNLTTEAFEYGKLSDDERKSKYGNECVANNVWRKYGKDRKVIAEKPSGRTKAFKTLGEQLTKKRYADIYSREFIHIIQQEMCKFLKRFEKLQENVVINQLQMYWTEAKVKFENSKLFVVLDIFADGSNSYEIELTPFKSYEDKYHLLVGRQCNCRILFDRYKSDYHVHFDLRLDNPPCISDRNNGRLGVDLNNKSVSCTLIDKDGNILRYWDIPHALNLTDVSYGKKKQAAINIAAKLVRLGKRYKVPVIVEDLGHKQGDSRLAAFNKWAFGLFFNALSQRAVKQNKLDPHTKLVENYSIEVAAVPSPHTSKKGAMTHSALHKKYPNISEGQCAAYCIAMRHLNSYKEEPLWDIVFSNSIKNSSKRLDWFSAYLPKWFLDIYIGEIKARCSDFELYKKASNRHPDKIDPNKFKLDKWWQWQLISRRGNVKKKEEKYAICGDLLDLLFKLDKQGLVTLSRSKTFNLPHDAPELNMDQSNETLIKSIVKEHLDH